MSLPEFDWQNHGPFAFIAVMLVWALKHLTWIIVRMLRPAEVNDIADMKQQLADFAQQSREDRRVLHEKQDSTNQRLANLEGRLQSYLEGKK